MLKILYTINFLTNGGPTRVLQNIINGLNSDKFEIYILTLINENDKEIVYKLSKKGIKIISLDYNKSLKQIIKNKNNIISKINEINPDIIHTHGIVSTMIVNSDKIKSKKITTIHNSIFEDYKYTYGRMKGIIYAYVHILALKKFDEVICCSKTSYEVLKKYIKNAKYIRNGIDIEENISDTNIRANIRKELGIKDNDIIYIYGGVINSRKRVVELVELFNNTLTSNEYLVIVGDGELKSEAENVKKNSNIIFTGFKTNIIDYFKSSDIYVSNSSSEGFSISVIEALECGLLLFISDIPSHRECFEIDNNYYLGETFNTKDFAEKKQKITKNNIGDKDKIKEFKNKYLSSKVMSDQYKKYY